MCYILRLKCTKFYSRRLSFRPSVRPFVRSSQMEFDAMELVDLRVNQYPSS